ncbi:flavin reductase family protein [Pseudalkalibacillus caeni]|uniref:Flavin reductase family protein n=1 Tax=Exobacillus caeni TaxID=2574798 RepID=A0A5R9F5X3_9BACL|nr:flavin reductase family protein [Pseudalkalibacillus caeni]TLS36223.1 flavin reductase family protein [Pseudalkalibacillus caeni]
MNIDPNEISGKELYKLLIGSVIPRPIAWISTESKEGVFNLAPFSFFTVASAKPPMLCISIAAQGKGERRGTVKDTLANIREQEEFVINFVPFELTEPMHKSSANLPSESNEFEYAEVTPVKSVKVKPPGVEESPIKMECKLDQIIRTGSNYLVIGEMIHYSIKDEFYAGNYKTDIEKLNPLARLAGNYAGLGDIFGLSD